MTTEVLENKIKKMEQYQNRYYLFSSVFLIVIVVLLSVSIGTSKFTNMEGWDNPYAARLVQCASDGLPGTQSGANCWGQLGSQGCPPGLPKCAPGEGFLGNETWGTSCFL